jgi:hypothetical protein
MNPRVVLRLLIKRLEAKGASQVPRADFAAWEDSKEQARLYERAAAGELHFAEALNEAREALVSADDARIVAAAMICPALERKGQELMAQHRHKARRRKGGQRRGANLTTRRAAVWEPWVLLYEAMLAGGEKPAKARRKIQHRMTKQEFVDPETGEFPAERTIRKWLPAKIVGKQL